MADESSGDFIITLSSEMISDIVQRHLNEVLLRVPVVVVDVQAVGSGYAFAVAFEDSQEKFSLFPASQTIIGRDMGEFVDVSQYRPRKRDKTGRFSARKGSDEPTTDG